LSIPAGENGVAPLSRGTAIILLFVYGCYLYFQLKTHIEVYNAPSVKNPKKPSKKDKGSSKKDKDDVGKSIASAGGVAASVAGANAEQHPRDPVSLILATKPEPH